MRIDNPTVLVTRPEADALRFVEMLRRVAGPFDAIVSPAFSYEQITLDVPEFETAVFTSKIGVSFAPKGGGRRAYCVGDATAEAARQAGYDALSAQGSAEDLVTLILSEKPSGALSHLRGEISRGDVSVRLNAAGLDCADVVLYRKVWLSPNDAAGSLVCAGSKVIVPLFSAETVSIITQWPLSLEGCTVVAISDEVAQAAGGLCPAEVIVSAAPNMEAMALAVGRKIA